jgi:transcriptional regulator ATRX
MIHTVLNHPNIRGRLKSAIVVAPVNTLSNWEDEFEKWTGNVEPRLFVENLAGKDMFSRDKAIERWSLRGGILLLGEQLFLSMQGRGTKEADKRLLETDVLVLDEAHTMLKNSNNKVFKALSDVKTMRRILLTGTPLQNNVTEYFRMIQFANPGAIDGIMTEAEFERKYRYVVGNGTFLLSKELSLRLASWDSHHHDCLLQHSDRAGVTERCKPCAEGSLSSATGTASQSAQVNGSSSRGFIVVQIHRSHAAICPVPSSYSRTVKTL